MTGWSRWVTAWCMCHPRQVRRRRVVPCCAAHALRPAAITNPHTARCAGIHEVSCPIWRPVGSTSQELASFFLGGYPQLRSTSVLATASSERHRLVTTGTGTVHLRLEIVFRHMELHSVEW